jgi:hypothetical protein
MFLNNLGRRVADRPFLGSLLAILYGPSWLAYKEKHPEARLQLANKCTIDAVCFRDWSVRPCDEVRALRSDDIEEVLLVAALSARLEWGRHATLCTTADLRSAVLGCRRRQMPLATA